MARGDDAAGIVGDDELGTVDPRFVFGDDDGGNGSSGGGSGDDSGNGGGSGSGGSDGSVGTPKRRGRPKGSVNRKPRAASSASVAASIDGLTNAIHLLHFGLANGVLAMTKNANLARVFLLTPEESKGIAVPLAAIQNRYIGETNGDLQLMINLGTALVGTYGGKLMAAMMTGQANGATAPAS